MTRGNLVCDEMMGEFDVILEEYFDLLEEKGRPFPIHLLNKETA